MLRLFHAVYTLAPVAAVGTDALLQIWRSSVLSVMASSSPVLLTVPRAGSHSTVSRYPPLVDEASVHRQA